MIFTKKASKIGIFGILLLLTSLLRFSFVWGSKSFFFSGFCLLAPLLGGLLGLSGAGGAFLLAKGLRYTLFGKLFSLTAGIPTLVATTCWALEDAKTRGQVVARFACNVLVPLCSFALFVFHPSVGHGFWYGFYWFIPVGLYGARACGFLQKSVAVPALQSTFLAHAVGSVIWCYTIPMTPDAWLALIPIVAVERFVLAGGMVVVWQSVGQVRGKRVRRRALCNI